MLLLKLNGETIRQVAEGQSFQLANGDVVSPAYFGWSDDTGYSLSDVPEPTPPTEVELLEAERAGMVCSKLQGRIALRRANKLDAVEALVAAVGGETQIAWDLASELRRMSSNVISLAQHPSVGMTDLDLDDLFRVARTISF